MLSWFASSNDVETQYFASPRCWCCLPRPL